MLTGHLYEFEEFEFGWIEGCANDKAMMSVLTLADEIIESSRTTLKSLTYYPIHRDTEVSSDILNNIKDTINMFQE